MLQIEKDMIFTYTNGKTYQVRLKYFVHAWTVMCEVSVIKQLPNDISSVCAIARLSTNCTRSWIV